jgi:ankyrin repeat protein
VGRQVWIACTFGQQRVLAWLLARGADPTQADNGGRTPLFQVIRGHRMSKRQHLPSHRASFSSLSSFARL